MKPAYCRRHERETRKLLDMEIIFLGTGTSSNVPSLGCVLQDPVKCNVCLDAAINPSSKNRRRNTSALIRVDSTNILIDCGKTFYESVINATLHHKLSKIDGVLLTHGHADAILGLDDLRGWTMNGRIQNSVNVYLTRETFAIVQTTFPYLVDRKKATGSGEVGSLNFTIIPNDSDFFINDVKITPLPVHHGIILETNEIYWNTGFRIGNMSYIADVNFIPDSTFLKLKGTEVLVIDGLKWEPHGSHFSFDQGLRTCLKVLGSSGRGFLTGICHRASHEELNQFLENDTERRKLGIHVQAAYDNLLVKCPIVNN